jgi:hypothetical protein
MGQECQKLYLVGSEDGVGDASAEGRESQLSWIPRQKEENAAVGSGSRVQHCHAMQDQEWSSCVRVKQE